jgi:hypothetical protein
MIDPDTESYNNCHFWSNFQVRPTSSLSFSHTCTDCVLV